MFRPRAMMAVDVMARVCARRVRAGVTLADVDGDGASVGRSAGRIDKEKSAPEERRTREEGKNLREVTVLKCGFATLLRDVGGVIVWVIPESTGSKGVVG